MSSHPDTILFLHPSAELYGGDCTLQHLVKGLDPSRWRAEVVLPRRGPLASSLEASGVRVHIMKLGLAGPTGLRPDRLLGLVCRAIPAALRVWRLARRVRPALIHTNTGLVVGGSIGARLASAPHLWHLRGVRVRSTWLPRLLADVVVPDEPRTPDSSLAHYVRGFDARYEALLGRGPGARVIHLIHGALERFDGVVQQLAQTQQAQGRGVEVWSLCATPSATRHDPTSARPYELRRFQSRRGWLGVDPGLMDAIKAAPRPTLFHLHGGPLPEMALAARAIRRAGHAYVFTPHGTYGQRDLTRQAWIDRLERVVFDQGLVAGAQRVQARSEREAAVLAQAIPRDAIAVVPDGQDLLEGRGRLSDDSARPLFGFLGRLDAKIGGLDVLIDAFASHAQRHPGCLRIIGDGPDLAMLIERVAQAGVAERVEFLGALSGEDRRVALSDCDAAILPSRHDLQPGAVLEAAALGLPLVVTAGTGLAARVLHHRAGLALAETAPGPLIDAMAVIATSPGTVLRGWARGARAMVSSEFTWQHVTTELERELYRLNSTVAEASGEPVQGVLQPVDVSGRRGAEA